MKKTWFQLIKNVNMKELKFRGISVDTGIMEYGWGVILVPNMGATIIHKQGINMHQHTEVIPETVGQYTFHTDKKGNPIYEGDILKGRHGYYLVPEIPEFLSYIFKEHYWFSDQEIAGNKFDNPELLKTN